MCDPPHLVWPVFPHIAAFVLGLYSTFEKENVAFGLLSLLASLKMMLTSSIYVSVNNKISFFFVAE
jgi:hypothetical protein